MADRDILFRLDADVSGVVSSSAAAAGATSSLERAVDQLGGAAARSARSQTAFSIAQQQGAQSLAQIANWEASLSRIREAAQNVERQRFTEQERFIASLERQTAAIGRTRAEMIALDAAKLGVSARAAPLVAKLSAAEKAAAGFGKTGQMTAYQTAQLSFQLQDLGVQIAGGQNPLLALVQQGSQLAGTFGSARGALSAVASIFTVGRVAAGGLAAAVGAVALAYAQGFAEQAKFNNSLLLTNNRAGLTEDSFNALAASVAESANVSVGSAREITQALAATGQVGPAALGSLAEAGALMSSKLGQSTEQVVEQLTRLARDPARVAVEMNRTWNVLTVDIYRQIEALQKQGKEQQAAALFMDLITAKAKQMQPELGTLEKAWKDLAQGVNEAWQALMNIGKTDTTAVLIERTEQALRALDSAIASPDESGSSNDRERERLQQRLEDLQETARVAARSARTQAEAAQANAKAVEEEAKKRTGGNTAINQAKRLADAQIALDKANAAKRLALADESRDQEMAALETQRARLLVGEDEFALRRAAIQRAALADRAQVLAQEIALEQKRVLRPGSEDALRREQRLVDLERERIELRRQAANIDDGGRAFDRAVAESEAAVARENVQRRRERIEAAERASGELADINQRLGLELIADDRARAQAQLAIEMASQSARIAALQQGTAARIEAEGRLAEFQRLRNAQLAEQFKPQWQRYLDEWQNTERRRQQITDEINARFVEGGREAFGRWFAEGKLSFDNLGDYLLRTLGEQLYERLGFGETFKQIGNAVADGLQSILGVAAGGGAGQAAGQSAAQAAAVAEASSKAQIAAADAAARAADIAQRAAESAAIVANTSAVAAHTAVLVPADTALVALTAAANAAAASLSAVASSGGGGGGDGLADLFGSFLGGGGGGGLGLPSFGSGLEGITLGKSSGLPARSGGLGKVDGSAAFGGASAPSLKVSVHNYANAQVQTQQRQDGGLDVIVRQVEQGLGGRIDNGLGLARNMGKRFSLADGPALVR